MLGATLRQKLINGKTVYGSIFQYAVNPAMVDALPPDTLDFVILSSEHNALNLTDFQALRYSLAAKGIACLVRTHSRDAADVAKVCDNFDGVVVPYVEGVGHAKRLAAAAVYRPLKGEVLERVITKGEWPNQKTKEYIAKRNENTVFIPMIESVPAIERIDEICSIPGVHAVFVGPGDLTTNMGIPREYDNPLLITALQRVIDAANRHHVAAGCWFGEVDQAARTMKQGARLVVYSNDGAMLQNAMVRAYGELKKNES